MTSHYIALYDFVPFNVRHNEHHEGIYPRSMSTTVNIYTIPTESDGLLTTRASDKLGAVWRMVLTPYQHFILIASQQFGIVGYETGPSHVHYENYKKTDRVEIQDPKSPNMCTI